MFKKLKNLILKIKKKVVSDWDRASEIDRRIKQTKEEILLKRAKSEFPPMWM